VVLAAGASAPQGGDVYQIFNKAITGSFATITLPTLAAGLEWDTDSLAVDGSIRVRSAVPPTIGNVGIVGGNFTFSGSGGVEGATYYIVTSPEVAAPMSTWVPVATNVFGPGGTFNFSTDAVAAAEAFFRLKTP
jgi:hypothetical protein